MSTPTTNRRFVRANLVVAAGTGLSRLTGFGRVAALAYALGLTSLTDTYNLANTMPNVVLRAAARGILTTTLVPVFVEQLDHDDEEATDAVVSVAVIVCSLSLSSQCSPRRSSSTCTRWHGSRGSRGVRSEATTLVGLPPPDRVLRHHVTRDRAPELEAPLRRGRVRSRAQQRDRDRGPDRAPRDVVNGDINLDTALGHLQELILI